MFLFPGCRAEGLLKWAPSSPGLLLRGLGFGQLRITFSKSEFIYSSVKWDGLLCLRVFPEREGGQLKETEICWGNEEHCGTLGVPGSANLG